MSWTLEQMQGRGFEYRLKDGVVVPNQGLVHWAAGHVLTALRAAGAREVEQTSLAHNDADKIVFVEFIDMRALLEISASPEHPDSQVFIGVRLQLGWLTRAWYRRVDARHYFEHRSRRVHAAIRRAGSLAYCPTPHGIGSTLGEALTPESEVVAIVEHLMSPGVGMTTPAWREMLPAAMYESMTRPPVSPAGCWRALLDVVPGLDAPNGQARSRWPLDGGVWLAGDLGGGPDVSQLFDVSFTIAHNGSGDCWVAEVCTESRDVVGVYYLSHDPPQIVFLACDLIGFLHIVQDHVLAPMSYIDLQDGFGAELTELEHCDKGRLVLDLTTPGSCVELGDFELQGEFEREDGTRRWRLKGRGGPP